MIEEIWLGYRIRTGAGIKTGALPLGDTPSVQRLRNGAGGET